MLKYSIGKELKYRSVGHQAHHFSTMGIQRELLYRKKRSRGQHERTRDTKPIFLDMTYQIYDPRAEDVVPVVIVLGNPICSGRS